MSIIEKAIDRLNDGDKTSTRVSPDETLASHARAERSIPERHVVPTTGNQAAAQLSGHSLDSHLIKEAGSAADIHEAVPDFNREGLSDRSGPEPGSGQGEAAFADLVRIVEMGPEGIISPSTEGGRTAEEFRVIKRPLLQRASASAQGAGEHSNLIVVTSSVAGEGKTFTSLNLAISIAMELDRTVLLVDADLANPGLSRLLKIHDRPGLTDRLLDDHLDLRSLLLRTDVPKLTLLPAGRRNVRATELLASNVMRVLLDELASRYPDRIVLFDSPPLLATTEASVLANQAGQVCVVVESGTTPQFLVKEALGMLQHQDRVSLVLNKTKRDLLLAQYGYGYRYGYRYGYGKGSEGAKA